MGYVLELLPKEIITENGDFLNANGQVGGKAGVTPTSTPVPPNSLYAKAQSNYDAAINNLTTAQNKISSLQAELSSIVADYKPIESDMTSGDSTRISRAIEEILTRRKYRLNEPMKSWNNPLYGWDYLYDGASGIEAVRSMQRRLVNEWIDKNKKREQALKSEINSKTNDISRLQKNVDDAKKELDRLIESEQKASEVRIAEQQAKNAPELARIASETELKKRKQRTILILGAGAILVIGGFFILKKKK